MTAETLLDLYSSISDQGIKIWLDGGWGVDALLGKQTRVHTDVDFVVEEQNLPKLEELLNSLGWGRILRDDTREWNFMLGDNKGNEIDIHIINLDKKGNGIYGPAENEEMYPASSLEGRGSIYGKKVNCLTAEYQIISHTGYTLKEKDFKDVSLLCQKFGIAMPPEYDSFKS